MSEPSYRYRAHPFARARIYRLGEKDLLIGDGVREWSIPYADFTFIEAFDVRFLGSSTPYRRHILRTRDGRTVALSAGFRDPWQVSDKRADYRAFVDRLMASISAANPDREYISKRLPLNRAGGLGGKITVLLLRLSRHTNPDRWADATAWTMRRVGPRLRGHRRALQQLAIAFPEKSPEERERIAIGMWDNLARTVAEYAQLDLLWRHDPAHPERSRVIRTEESTGIWTNIKAANRRSLHFSLHIANWELCAIAGPQHGLVSLIPYRRLKNRPLTDELVRIRVAAGTTPLTAGPSLISDLRRKFGEGDALGMLIDQHYVQGVEVTFFGRPTLFNPLFARLVRLYDCPVYGSRIIRRDDGRFDYEIVGPIEPTRDERRRVDVHATTQLYASLMERWIREHPEQWLWLHPTWR
jgi:Kdo2-lipid IVA lauroyltransferase/acyltransferase